MSRHCLSAFIRLGCQLFLILQNCSLSDSKRHCSVSRYFRTGYVLYFACFFQIEMLIPYCQYHVEQGYTPEQIPFTLSHFGFSKPAHLLSDSIPYILMAKTLFFMPRKKSGCAKPSWRMGLLIVGGKPSIRFGYSLYPEQSFNKAPT